MMSFRPGAISAKRRSLWQSATEESGKVVGAIRLQLPARGTGANFMMSGQLVTSGAAKPMRRMD